MDIPSTLSAKVAPDEHVSPLPSREGGPGGIGPLLGISKGVAVYLLFNGVLHDRAPESGNVLTRGVLNVLPPHDGPKVIYGTGCLLSEALLRQLGITFKQIPYEVRVS